MNKKKTSYGIRGMLALTVVFIVMIAVSFRFNPVHVTTEYDNLYSEYTETVESYNSLMSRYNEMYNAFYDTYISYDELVREYVKVTNNCETSAIPCPVSMFPLSNYLSAETTKFPLAKTLFSTWIQYSSTIPVLALGIFALALMGIQTYQYKRSNESIAKQFETDKNRDRQKALEEGRRETYKSLALELVSDKDVMSDLTKWLNEYEQGEAELEYSAYIHSQILSRLMKQIHLNPIAKIGEIVAYDPNQHKTFDQLKLSEKVVVVEAGWRVGREVIKLPLVRRK